MSKDIITKIDTDYAKLIHSQIAPKLNEKELIMFLNIAQSYNLCPLRKQIYAVKYNTKNGPVVAYIVGINGLRTLAMETGVYGGRDETQFIHMDDDPKKPIYQCVVTVHRKVQGERCPFTATVYYDDFYPKSGANKIKWDNMPHQMIDKCCEAKALRMAFPDVAPDVYDEHEFHKDRDNPTSERSREVNEILDATPSPKTPDFEDVKKEPLKNYAPGAETEEVTGE